MAPKTRVQALLLADHVYTDAETGKKVIAGVFSELWNREFPNRFTRTACVYVLVTDIRGTAAFEIRYVDNTDLAVLATSPTLEISAQDPFVPVDFYIRLPPFPMPHPGSFSFELHADGEKIGEVRLLIHSIDHPGTSQ